MALSASEPARRQAVDAAEVLLASTGFQSRLALGFA
jgi:hypothetical protein